MKKIDDVKRDRYNKHADQYVNERIRAIWADMEQSREYREMIKKTSAKSFHKSQKMTLYSDCTMLALSLMRSSSEITSEKTNSNELAFAPIESKSE